MRACLFRTSHDGKNAHFGTINSAPEVIRRTVTVNFGCDFERDQARRRVLITRNLAELVRLNLDLVPIKGPQEANWRRVHPAQTGSLTLISTSEHLPWLFPSSSFILPTRSPRSPRRHPFSRFISRSCRVPDELATAPGIDDVYGRTPVIGWSRFIDGRISRFERALWARDARRGIPAAIPISGEFPRTLRLPFRNFRFTRDRSVRICRDAPASITTIAFLGSALLHFPRNKTSRIKYYTLTILKRICRARGMFPRCREEFCFPSCKTRVRGNIIYYIKSLCKKK